MAVPALRGACISGSPLTRELSLILESTLQERQLEALRSLSYGRWAFFHLGLAGQGASGAREAESPRAAPPSLLPLIPLRCRQRAGQGRGSHLLAEQKCCVTSALSAQRPRQAFLPG